MSDLNEALAIADHYWEGEGLPPATEIIETLADAARRWANLTSPETVELADKRMSPSAATSAAAMLSTASATASRADAGPS
jgi:hypothetical protein